MLIAQQWFDPAKKSSEGLGDYSAAFNPIPLALIALAATAIECALNAWRNGTLDKAANHFTDIDYTKVYKRHIKNLEVYEKKAPAACLQYRRQLWQDAWCVVLTF